MSKEFDDKWRDIKNEMVIRMSNKAIGMGELLKLFNFVEAHIKELENEVAFWKDDADKERLGVIIDCLKLDCDKKDEKIAKLKLELFNTSTKIAQKKSRSIVAMLFWEWKKTDRYCKEYSDQTSMREQKRSEAYYCFQKAYKMLKATI